MVNSRVIGKATRLAPVVLLCLVTAALPGGALSQTPSEAAISEEKARQQFADPTGLSNTNTPGVQLAAEVTEDGAKASASATVAMGSLVGTLLLEAPFEKRTETSFVTLDGIESDVAATLGLRWNWSDKEQAKNQSLETACGEVNQVLAASAIELSQNAAKGLLVDPVQLRMEIPPADATPAVQSQFVRGVEELLTRDPGGDLPPPPGGSSAVEVHGAVARKLCEGWNAAHPDRVMLEEIQVPKRGDGCRDCRDKDLLPELLAGRVRIACSELAWMGAEALEGAARAAAGDATDAARVALANDLRLYFGKLPAEAAIARSAVKRLVATRSQGKIEGEISVAFDESWKASEAKLLKELFLDYRKRVEVVNQLPAGLAIHGRPCDSGRILEVLSAAPRGSGRARLFRALRDGLLSENAFILGAKVGKNDFEWIESVPADIPLGGEFPLEKSSKLSSSYSVAFSRLSRGLIWEARYSFKTKYKGADAVETCVPIAGSSGASCVDVAQSAPKQSESSVVELSLKRFEVPDFAWRVQVLYDVDNEVWNPHLQLYFLPQKKDAKLRGGLDLGYLIDDPKKGDEFLPRIFFGAALDEWLPGK